MKIAAKFMAAGALSAMLSGCVSSSPAGVNENDDGSTFRTPVQNLPTDCTIVTQERGVVNGRYVTYGAGTATRTCVSSNSAAQRSQGTDPLRQTQQVIRDVTTTAQQAKYLIYLLQ